MALIQLWPSLHFSSLQLVIETQPPQYLSLRMDVGNEQTRMWCTMELNDCILAGCFARLQLQPNSPSRTSLGSETMVYAFPRSTQLAATGVGEPYSFKIATPRFALDTLYIH